MKINNNNYDLKIQLRNGNIYEVIVGGVNNQRWQSIFSKCFESLGKAKPKFWEEFSKYEFSVYPEYITLRITYEWTTGGIGSYYTDDLYWDELLPESLIQEFSEKDWAIPDDLTPEQEFEMEKVIIKKIWEEYKG